MLHVEDDPAHVAFAARLAGGRGTGIRLRAVGTLAAATAALGAEAVDVVLLDLTLPDGRGLDAIRHVRMQAPVTPVVVLSGDAPERLAVDALGLGVDDVLVKDDVTAEALVAALRRAARPRPSAGGPDAILPARVAAVGTRLLVLEGLAAGLRGAERLVVLGPFASIDAMLRATGAEPPDVVVLEDTGGAGPDDPVGARARLGRAKLVVLADDVDRHLALVLERRVDGIALLTSSAEQIADALLLVLPGQVVLPGGWRPPAEPGADPLEAMSVRQREILRLVADGCSNEEIARRLYISVNTVKFHMRSIYSQLGVHNRLQAAMLFTHPSG